jgi:hypothetical protein
MVLGWIAYQDTYACSTKTPFIIDHVMARGNGRHGAPAGLFASLLAINDRD